MTLHLELSQPDAIRATLADQTKQASQPMIPVIGYGIRGQGHCRAVRQTVSRESGGQERPNWAAEIARITPSLKMLLAHPSVMLASQLNAFDPAKLALLDLVITSYGTLARLPWLTDTAWRIVILDEAQAIKNPNAKQTRATKQLGAEARVALTGTPIENRLADLWSIFDFINPGLFGSSRQFATWVKQLAQRQHNPYDSLRELVRPYILRRMKTDKSVIADLPDKTDVEAYCALSRKQAALIKRRCRSLPTASNRPKVCSAGVSCWRF